MQCWICGSDNPATREHRSKASDLRALFGQVSQASPMYFHEDECWYKKAGSLKADILKYEHRICLACNSAPTQAHDNTWKCCSDKLRMRLPKLHMGETSRLNRIFP